MIELEEVNSRIKIGSPSHYLIAIAICHRFLVINEMNEITAQVPAQTKKARNFHLPRQNNKYLRQWEVVGTR